MNPILCIPKIHFAGSDSVVDIILRQYTPNQILGPFTSEFEYLSRIRKYTKLEFDPLRVVIGMGACEGIQGYFPPERPSEFFTVLREPFAHTVSWFRNPNRIRKLKSWDATIYKELLEFAKKDPNSQARRFIGQFTTATIADEYLAEYVTNLINIQYLMLGTTELFTESMFLLSKIYGWKHHILWAIRSANTYYRPSLDSFPIELKEEIRAINNVDTDLHNQATAKITGLLQNLGTAELHSLAWTKKMSVQYNIIRRQYSIDACVTDAFIENPKSKILVVGDSHRKKVIEEFIADFNSYFTENGSADITCVAYVDTTDLNSLTSDFTNSATKETSILNNIDFILLASSQEWYLTRIFLNAGVPRYKLLYAKELTNSIGDPLYVQMANHGMDGAKPPPIPLSEN